MKVKRREIALGLLLSLAIIGAIAVANTPASAELGVAATCGVSGCVSTPSLTSTTTTSYSSTSTSVTRTTSSKTSTGLSSSTTTTTATTTSTFFSYTSTVSTTLTTTSWSTSFTGTQTSTNTNWVTVPTTTTSSTIWTSMATVKGNPTSCPVSFVTGGSPLEPYANFLRNFRNTAIENTTAGREFLLTFNTWYYSWAPSLSYSAATNPWIFKAVQVGVYPLIAILYASYYSYTLVTPLSSEAGAIAAGIVAASLIGAVYLAPVGYVASRLVRRHGRLLASAKVTVSSAAWFGASALICVVAYATGSGQLLAVATSSMVLSMVSLGSLAGSKALGYVQIPFASFPNAVLVFRRLAKAQF